MKNFAEQLKLRDPIWQAIGTIVGVATLLVSTIVAYDIYQRSTQLSELTVEEIVHFDPLKNLFGQAMKDRVALLIDNSAVESSMVYYFLISNTGKNPITPDDYIEPIQVSVESPWVLLANDVAYSSPSELKMTTWTKVTTNTFEMEPALLNPGDAIGVLLFTTDPTGSGELPDLKWTARIVNVQSLKTRPRGTLAEQSGLGVLYTSIRHEGWNIYWFGGFALLLFFVGVSVGLRSGRFKRLTLRQIVLLSAIVMLSFSSAEIAVDTLFEHRSQWWGAWLLVGSYLLLLIYLFWPIVKVRNTSLKKK